jgi:glutamyl-tRNA synthetase
MWAMGHVDARGRASGPYPVRCAVMPSARYTTRFAPSPTGSLHLGNARTALFSYLAAKTSGGRFVLRIEDTDAERSQQVLLDRQLEELRWFGLQWDEGPDVGGPHAPYRQSERAAFYDQALAELAERRLTYPCFCSPEELQLSRRAQLSAGRPPRYARTCANLSQAEVQRRIDAGLRPAVRFRVPDQRAVEFSDLIHGAQRFMTDDIGDFVVRRADGSAAFFLSNALDDSAMGITLVLRGDDHLANTPRQLLILEALGRSLPAYGHLPLLLAPSGSPLSKREGAASLTDLRAHGYFSGAIRNYLLRLGHASDSEAFLELDSMPAHFDLRRTSHSAARFDEAQLRHWQREALTRATVAETEAWLGDRLSAFGDDASMREAFVGVVKGNLMFPTDADSLVAVVTQDAIAHSAEAAAQIAGAGAAFFDAAREVFAEYGEDFKSWTRAIGAATGRKGATLFMPLRAALTGDTHGPELAPLVALMGSSRVLARLRQAAQAAGSTKAGPSAATPSAH